MLPVMETTVQRLFAPGTGAAPPALTGREREQCVLRRCLADLLDGNAPPHDVALAGPRGNGKTVLLNWFEAVCREAGRVAVTRLAPSRIGTEQALVEALLPPTGIRKLLPRKLGDAGVGQAEWAQSAPSAARLVERLITRCRRKPLVVLLDEAHTLDRDAGQLLLNASQDVRASAPLLLVLAGTPGLAAHLATMGASFWNQLGEGRLGIGLLDNAAARAALVGPLDSHGVAINDDALDAVVEDSQRYPYFVQLWGEALWRQRLATGATRLTAAHVDGARPDVLARISDYYRNRHRELETSGLLPAALATAPLFLAGADSTATDHDIDAALAATGTDAAGRLAMREGLHRLGYFWEPPGQVDAVLWVAGIPSLMAHVLDRAAPCAPVFGEGERS